jgi:hypothetical protein
MNTDDRMVENETIHLYRHLAYVARPATDAKKEYHNLVSPVVRRGGLSRVHHNPIINARSIQIEQV